MSGAKKVLDPFGGTVLGKLGGDPLDLIGKTVDLVFGTGPSDNPSGVPPSQTADRQVTVTDTISNAVIVYGQQRLSGVFAFYGLSGANNEYLHFIVALTCHQVQSLDNLEIDGTFIPNASIDGAGNVTAGPYAGLVQVRYHLGSPTQATDANITAVFPEWDATKNGKDISYIWVRCKLDDAAFPNIPRRFRVDITGKLVYDQRLDTTNGGAGPQRFATPSTWAWNNNMVLCAQDYLRDQPAHGCRGWQQSILDDLSNAIYASVCDESVNFKDAGVTIAQARYTVNVTLSTGNTYQDNLQLLLNAGAAHLDPSMGGFIIRAGHFDSPAVTIDETWLDDSDSFDIQYGEDQNSSYNAVRGTYFCAAIGYQNIDFNPYTNSSYETDDDGNRTWYPNDLDLSASDHEYRCQRLARLLGQQSRDQIKVNWAGNQRCLKLRTGDVVTVNLTGYFTAKTFRVWAGPPVMRDSGLGTNLLLIEETSADWSWASTDSKQVTFAPDPALAGELPPAPTLVSAYSGADKITIEVIPPPGGQYDYIEMSRSPDAVFAHVNRIARFQGSLFHDTVTNGTLPNYWMRSHNKNAGFSAYTPSTAGAGMSALPKVTPDSTRATFNLGAGDPVPQWRDVARMDSEGTATRATFEVKVGCLTSGASSGFLFKVGMAFDNATGSVKLEYINAPTSRFSQFRLKQTAAGDVILQINQVQAGTEPFVVEVYPCTGTYVNKPYAVAGVTGTAVLSAAIVGATNFAGVVQGTYHASGLSVEDRQTGEHYRMGFPFADNNGQIADQTRLFGINGGGYANGNWTGAAFTPHPTSMNIAAGTLNAGSTAIAYAASSKTGLANSTTYSFYYSDQALAGGTHTLLATTSKRTLTNDDSNVYIGDGTTQAAGGTGGGGGIGSCVAVEMFLHRRLRAQFAHLGDWCDWAHDFENLPGFGNICAISHYFEPCVRLVAENGCALVCSKTTPFTIKAADGTITHDNFAPGMKGKPVLTDLGVSLIVSVEDVGSRAVARISAGGDHGEGGLSYYAGELPNRRICSHNTIKP